ncbi:hypothetical protein FACS1894184_04240 [Clostridia bacterium]|nr:hypothetical protein FACS1894184_04240 [Clostridia bacterium]
MTFRVRLTITLLTAALLPLLIFATAAYNRVQSNALNDALASSEAIFIQQTQTINQNIRRAKNTALDIVSDNLMSLFFIAIRDHQPDKLSLFRRIQIQKNWTSTDRTLNAHLAAQRDIVFGIGLSLKGRSEYTMTAGAISVCLPAVVAAYERNGAPVLYIDHAVTDEGTGSLHLTVSFSSFDMNDQLGVCTVSLNASRIFGALGSSGTRDDNASGLIGEDMTFVADGQGRVIFSSGGAARTAAAALDILSDHPADDFELATCFLDIHGKQYAVTYLRFSENPDWVMYHLAPYTRFLSVSSGVAGLLLSIALICAGLAIAASLIAVGWAYQPIRALADTLRSMHGSNLTLLDEQVKTPELQLFHRSFNVLLRDIQMLLDRVAKEGERAKVAEIVALRAQISPHFLYNTLNVIKILAMQNQTEAIQSAVTSLSVLLRASIGDARDIVPMKEELTYSESYVALQRLRLDLSFAYQVDVPDELLGHGVPRLFLQPMLENALLHAFTDVQRTVNRIDVRASLIDGYLVVTVEDNGQSAEISVYEQLNSQFTPDRQTWTNKVGLQNTYERALRLFGENAHMNIQSTSHEGRRNGTIVTLTIPAKEVANS